MNIRFGTSGWRAVIADEFTFAGVRCVTSAICSHFGTASQVGNLMVVGYDTRFLGEKFAEECANIISKNAFRVLLCDQPVPTPTISHVIRTKGAICGINFTASHNPPQYNGMKLSTSDGAPALPEVTRSVEDLIKKTELTAPATKLSKADGLQVFSARPGYLEDLRTKINFDAIAGAGGRYAYDPLWGTGRGYLDEILRTHGLEVETIHNWRDVLFGGRSPEPEASHLEELREIVVAKQCVLGLATDGDADRFGIIDSNGSFITPNQLIALLFDYLVESREWCGGAAR
jgi:phosphoglucomutase